MKLMHFWSRTYDTFDRDASLIAYANMSAFKFPDRMQVYLTCNVEVLAFLCMDYIVSLFSVSCVLTQFCARLNQKQKLACAISLSKFIAIKNVFVSLPDMY